MQKDGVHEVSSSKAKSDYIMVMDSAWHSQRGLADRLSIIEKGTAPNCLSAVFVL
jgi:hypothetical protein